MVFLSDSKYYKIGHCVQESTSSSNSGAAQLTKNQVYCAGEKAKDEHRKTNLPRFTKDLEKADIIHVHNKNDKTNIENYWSINILPTISKTYDQIYS